MKILLATLALSLSLWPAARASELGTLVDVAVGAGQFETLAAALDAAGLVDTIANGGPFTVLAPTDEAFARLPKEVLEELLRPRNKDALTAILTYHVISGRVSSTQAVAAGSAETLQHGEVTFSIENGQLRVNDAGVVLNDIQASNGTIHVIDQVLLPPDLALPQPEGRKVIGIYTETPSRALASQLDIDRESSLLVTRLTDDGYAGAAGIQAYDVIVSIDGRPATDANLTAAKEQRGVGGRIELEVLRQARPLSYAVMVGVDPH